MDSVENGTKPYLVEVESRLREYFVLEAPDEYAARKRMEAAGPEALKDYRVGAQWSEAWEIVSVQEAPPEAVGRHYRTKEERQFLRILELTEQNRRLLQILAAVREHVGDKVFDEAVATVGRGASTLS